MDTSAEEIAQLEQIVVTLRRRLGALELQRARQGEHTPPHIILEIEDIKRELVQRWANLRRLRPGPTGERAPYLGLLTFREQDAERFFGRAALVAELVERAGRAPFLAVLGPSGSGKSSVVRAGLIPMLKGGALPGSERWRYLTIKPSARPIDLLATELTKLQGGDLSSVLLLSRQLAETERALLLAAGLLLDRAAGQRLVIVIDQAEELWTLAPAEPEARAAFVKEQQRPFIDQLLAAAAPDTPLLIVLTMRADFLHRAAEHTALARAIADHDLIVSPMAPAELREAIERPAELAGGGFEPGLVDELIARTTDREGALPLLEYTLLELWNARRPDDTLAWETYRAIGGVEGGLARRADTILARQYTPAQQAELRALLLRLVQPGEGATDTRRRVLLDDLLPAGDTLADLQALLDPLVEARLLVISGSAGSEQRRASADAPAPDDGERPSAHSPGFQPLAPATVEIAHEALIRAWPTLRMWIDEDRANLFRQLQLAAAAQEWEENGASADFLWSGGRLEQAEEWVGQARPRLNQRDRSFLDASRVAEQQRLTAEQAARQPRQIIGSAIGSGLGYSVALLYLTIAASAGALLTGASPVTWGPALLFLLQAATAGAFVGPVIVVALQRRIQSDWRAGLIAPLFGALAGAIPMLLVALSYTRFADLTLGVLTRVAIAGALTGAGLGTGASVTIDKWRQFGAIVFGGMLAIALGHTLVSFPPGTLLTALIGGAILGGLTGAGFLITAAESNRRIREEHSHG
jgi:hypothetical protein